MGRRFKVAFIHPDLGIGGAERLVLDVAIVLADNKHKVEFVTNHFDPSHAFEELKGDRFRVQVIGDSLPRSICGLFQAFCAYVRMIYLALIYLMFTKKEDLPDVYFVDQIPMAVPIIKMFGGRVIYYCHHPDLLASPPGGFLKKLYRYPIDTLEMWGTAKSDVILVNSRYTASVFRKTFPQICKDIRILYPTISSACQEAIISTVKVPMSCIVLEIQPYKDAIYFLSINRFHPAKSLEFALYGLKNLKNKLMKYDWGRVHLVMAGGYDPQNALNARYFQELVQLAHKLEVTEKVTFLKSPDDQAKAQMLLACDCLIYTPMNEHFGIVPLEAMCASKPVIACRSGGPCETVEHNQTGYLCKPTAEDLANYMHKIVTKGDAAKMGKLGKERLDLLFSQAHFSNKVIKVIFSAVHSQINFDKSETQLARVAQQLITKEDSSLTNSSNSLVREDNLAEMKTEMVKNFVQDHLPEETTYLNTT